MILTRLVTVRNCIAFWCVFGNSVGGADWPRFLGPNQDGTSAETGLNLEWGEKGPPVLWRSSLGASFSPPVVAAGRLVVCHRRENEEVVECLDARTGEPQWTASYATHYVDLYRYNGGPRSSPAIDGQHVFTYGTEGAVSCWELSSGRRVWQRRLHAELSAPQEFFGVGTPPVIEGGLVLLNPGGPDGAGLVALDKKDGRTVWRTGNCGASYSTPVLADIAGRRLALFLTKDGLSLVLPKTGNILHEFPFRSPLRESVNAASPVVIGNQIFLSAAYEVGSVMLELKPDGLHPIWRDAETMQNHWATSIHHEGYLYGLHGRHPGDAVMRCLDWRTGDLQWTSPRLRTRLTFSMADGHFIAMGERGRLLVIEVNPKHFVLKSEARILSPPCWAPPVLANGLLYVRNETELLCLDLRLRERD